MTIRLSLADLQAHDPHTPDTAGAERRCCCPLTGCAAKRVEGAHRSLSVHRDTGRWHCHRCGGRGRLVDAPQGLAPAPVRRARPTSPTAAPAPRPTPTARPVGGVRRWSCTTLDRRTALHAR